MDLSTIHTTLVILIITILLMIMGKVIKLKKKNKIMKELTDFANENGRVISKCDFWSNTKIGFDKENGVIFFIRTVKGNKNKFVINLQEVLKCNIAKITRTVTIGKTNQEVIDKIELVFTFKDKNNPGPRLEFYNTDYDQVTLSGELQLSEKWVEIANSYLRERKR